MPDMPDKFVCASCGRTFEKLWTDADALEESRTLFGLYPRDDLVQVCDECFRRIIEQLGKVGW
jgi:hypothetical protein